MKKNLLARLNDRQKKAALHKTGPLLILAGAGSGKTTTMATRIATLISQHEVSAKNILGLSFTRKAAQELKERVVKMVTQTSGKTAAEGLTLSTFHALCVRILREKGSAIGVSPNFTIIAETDQRDILQGIFKTIKLDDRKFDIDWIRFEISQAKNRFLNPEQTRQFFLESKRLSDDYAIAACTAYEHYQERLNTLQSLDFDDLLFKAVELLETHKDVRDFYGKKFKYILVDEYQDTNLTQFRLLKLLTQSHQNICVVGDDDQSIYGWRGADPTHILEFSKHFPGTEVITLDQNYRSTTSILDAANQVITKNPKRHSKQLWSENGVGEPITQVIVEEDRAESEMVAQEIFRRVNAENSTRTWSDFAILYRSNPQSRLFEEALRLHKIPYKIVGTLSYLERKEVKDVLCYLRLILNPNDDGSLRRICNWPARGISRTTLDLLNTQALNHGQSLWQQMQTTEFLSTLNPKAQTALANFTQLITDLKTDLNQTPVDRVALSDWAKRVLAKIQFKEALFEEHKDEPQNADRKWDNAIEIANAIGQANIDIGTQDKTSERILSAFLQSMTLDPDENKDKEDDQPKNQVTLLTLHGSKGLEFPVVFLVGVEEGLLPHRRALEEGTDLSEERRLCYVGITRAKQELLLTRAKTRIRYGKTVPRLPSRFLADIPSDLMRLQDESLSPDPSSKEQRQAHETQVKNFLSQLRSQIGATKS